MEQGGRREERRGFTVGGGPFFQGGGAGRVELEVVGHNVKTKDSFVLGTVRI